MKYAVYVNNEIVFSSYSKNECLAHGVILLTKALEKVKKNDSENKTPELLDKICNFTYNARKAEGSDFYVDCHYNDTYIEVKPFTEKTYEVTYKVTFEKDVTPNEDYFTMEYKVLCYENKVDKVIENLRVRLELDVYDDLSVRGESFNDMLGHEVECLQDEHDIYEVFDTINKKYHTIVAKEVKLN